MTAPTVPSAGQLASIQDQSNYGHRPGDGPLRPGGQPRSMASQGGALEEANLPSTPSAAAKRQQAQLQLVRDVAGGTETIRAARATYLPKAGGEHPDDYVARLNRSVFFNVFAKTIEGLAGFVFAKDPALGEDVPAPIAEHWENIDHAGTHGDVFARELFQDALTAGHAGILVEFPATGGTQDAASERTGGIRPYWVPIKKDNVVSWRTMVVHGRTLLSQLVLKETGVVPLGPFGERPVTRYRVFTRDAAGRRGVWVRLLEVTEDKKVVLLAEAPYPTQEEIPFVEIPTSGRKGLLESVPPLVDLAYLNIAHYQQWSDRATSVHMTCCPVWVETGIDADTGNGEATVVLGANVARRFTNPLAKAGYQSHDGQALGEVTKVIEELVSNMAALGLSMLAPSKRAVETAAAKRIDKAATDSMLGATARGLQDAIERALDFHARYMNLPEGGSVTINRDFEGATMDPALLTAYVGAVSNAGLPVRVLLDAMQKGGLIADDVDIEVLELEMTANAEAAAQQQADAAAAALSGAKGGTAGGKGGMMGGGAGDGVDAMGGKAA